MSKEGGVPVWNLFNEVLLTSDVDLAKELSELLKTTPVKLLSDASLWDPFVRLVLLFFDLLFLLSHNFWQFRVGKCTYGLSFPQVEATASEIPLHFALRTSVVETAKQKGTFFPSLSL